MLPQSIGKETNIKLPFAFIGYSLFALISTQLLLLTSGDALLNHAFRTPSVLAAAHLFVLGWALMVAMGAMYQLVPVAFLTPIWSERLGFFQFGVTAVGITLFSLALYFFPSYSLFPGLITLTGIMLFLFQMLMTLKQQANPNILTLFVGSGLFCLLFTIILGILLVISMRTGFLVNVYPVLFKSHLLLGTLGWFSLLIFGFSYKMVPMFSLSHGYSMKPAKFIYAVYVLGLFSMLISFITNSGVTLTISLGVLSAGFLYFCWHISIIIKKRVKRKLDRPFQFSLFAIVCGAILHIAAFISALFGSFSIWVGPLLLLYLLAWVGFSIIGYLYKIVPFLWWTYKYSKEIGKRQVPSLKEMIDERSALPLFIMLVLAAIFIGVSLLFNIQTGFYLGQALLTIASFLFSYVIIRVIKK